MSPLLLLLAFAVAALSAAAESQPPAAEPLRQLDLPCPEQATLSGGAQVWLLQRPSSPLVRLEVLLLEDPQPLSRRQVLERWLAAALLDKGTREQGPSQIDARLDRLGARWDAGRSPLGTWLRVEAPATELDGLLELAADLLLRPRFPRRAAHSTIRRWRRSQALASSSPGRLLQRAELRAVYGEDHPLARLPIAVDYRRLGPRHLRRTHRRLLEQAGAVILLSGDTRIEPALAALERTLGTLGAPGRPAHLPAPEAPAKGPELVLVDDPGSRLVRVTISLPVPMASQEDHATAALLTQVLGGSATGRLDRRLRDDAGLVYGASAALQAWPGHARLRLQTRLHLAQAPQGLALLEEQLSGLTSEPGQPGAITAAELASARARLLFDAAADLDTLRATAGRQRELAWRGLGPSVGQAQLDALASLDLQALQRAAAALDPSQATWIVVGDRERLEPALERSGLAPTRLWSGQRAAEGPRQDR